MSGNFKLILTNGYDDLELDYSVRNTHIASKWFEELSKSYQILENDRFINWGSHDVINELNRHIDIINEYEHIIDKRVSIHTTQKELNYLHKFFEDLRGEIVESTVWFKEAPAYVKFSVERFNVLIHQLEEELRQSDEPSVTVTFCNKPRFGLTQEDIKHFTYKWEYGVIYINYCHVGKPVLDVWKDRDGIAEGIRPQTHYSADFFAKFGRSTPWWYYQIRKLLINIWLLYKNFDIADPNIGMIPVADLKTKVSHQELFKYNKVKEVKCN